MRRVFLLTLAAALFAATSARADLILSGTTAVSGQGFGNINVVLTLHDQGTETGAIAPSNASTASGGYTINGGTTISAFGTCATSNALGGALGCGGGVANTSVVRDLSTLGLTSASQFGVLLNIAQDSNQFLKAGNVNGVIFEVNLYNSSGAVVASFPCLVSTCGYPTVGLAPNGQGQGSAGYLFTLNSAQQAELNIILCGASTCTSSTLAANTIFIGGAGQFTNANGGNEDISIARITSAIATPEPASLALFGSGLLGLGGLVRRRHRLNP